MKYLYLLLVFITSTAYAQQVHITGTVSDAQTKQPIPNVNISVQHKAFHYPADEKGEFFIATDKISVNDSIIFSCIGYQTKKIKAGDLHANKLIQLTPANTVLREVRIGTNSQSQVTLNTKVKFVGTGGIGPGEEIAMFMAGSQNLKGEIKSVGFFLSDGRSVAKGGDATAPFRIKLYGLDTSGAPGRALTTKIIIANATKNEIWFDVDLSSYHIPVPDSGFFVSFCLLDSQYYKFKKGFDGYYNRASPRLATSRYQPGDGQSYEGNMSLLGFEWHKDYWNDSYLIRATVTQQ